MLIDLEEQEVQLINHVRAISRFNRERILALARTAHQDYLRARKVQECSSGGGPACR